MSRRAATFTQADVARALRAAQQVGSDWQVIVQSGAIILVRGETKPASLAMVGGPPPHEEEPAPDWKF